MGLGLVVRLSCLVLCFVAMMMQMEGGEGCLENERIGLLEIKAYFVAHGADWAETKLGSWVDDRASNCCNWDRVNCANVSIGHVTELYLYHLQNYWNPTISRLNDSLFLPFKELVNLDLSDNEYDGWIDNQGFRKLNKLETLDLSGNSLNRSILPSLYGLMSLKTLKLSGNKFRGSFLSQDFLNFSRLELLDLSWNQLNGSLETQGFSRLKKLKTLDLSGNSLKSSILQSLSELTSLRALYLEDSEFGDSFFAQDFVNFSQLELLDLSRNQFNGSLEAQDLQYLRRLKYLDLSHNQLNGSIQGLCKMKALIELDLSNNMFSGQLPECLSNLTNLQVLDLSNTMFSGNFPSFTRNFTSLAYLSLFGNCLQGSFSLSNLANHSKLEILYMSSQNPRAQIETENTKWFPTFQLKALILQGCNLNKDKGRVTPSFLVYQHELELIDLSHNKLVGAFPNWLIQNNSRLRFLYLRNNSFVGNLRLSSTTRDMSSLDISNNNISGVLPKDIGIIYPIDFYLNMSMNNFEGNIPESIGEMKSLQYLDLSHNHFSGELPKQVALGCIHLLILKLSNNSFHGNIPKFSQQMNLQALYLNNNDFSGTLEEILSNNIRLKTLDISDNSFYGAIPSSIGKFSSVQILLMAENQLGGEIPIELSNMTQLKLLDLSQNKLFGPIPHFNLSFLKFLYLQDNTLSGSIPFTMCESSQLITLDLKDNKFSGNIPSWMNRLPALRVLLLGGNNFQGHIPIQLCELKNLTIMDISRNMIDGSIPSCLKNLSFGMIENDEHHGPNFHIMDKTYYASFYPSNTFFNANLPLDMPIMISLVVELLLTVEFRTKNNYYFYKGNILENMTGLDLSYNQLTGNIPSEIGNLQQLHALNLSHNYLLGSIPSTFSNLTQIESLDLSFNNLSGEIPSQLTQLNFLSNFNVSYNNLSGTPPSTRQFANFDEENYKGNPNLCGPLLKHKCEGPVVVSPSSQSKEKEIVIDMVAFYWSFIAAYITILLGFIMVLWISPQWRMVWFYFVEKVLHTCISLY